MEPLRWKPGGLTRRDVPGLAVEDGGPWAPRFGSVVDGQAGSIFGSAGTRQNLDPEIAFKWCVVGDNRAAALPGGGENCSAPAHVAGPLGRAGVVELLEELVSLAVPDAILLHSSEDEAIGCGIGAVRVERMEIDVVVASTAIVAPEVKEGGAAEAFFEASIAPLPRLGMIL
jgi:hypothetical protein